MKNPARTTRRAFLRGTAAGIIGGLAASSRGLLGAPLALAAKSEAAPRLHSPEAAPERTSGAALVHGDSRARNTYEALRLIEARIRAGLVGKKRIVIKPNMVSTTNQLSASHADYLEGILEFFASVAGDREIIIAESAASGPAAEGYDNFGYTRLANQYKVRLLDLDLQPITHRFVTDERFHPRKIRFSRLLLDPEVYLVSAAVMKTHDRVVATLSLKNVAVGAILKDTTFRWGRGGRGRNDKPIVHGGRGNDGIHLNLFRLAQELPPDLAILDGFQGMEHNGPVGGEPVDHRVAVASTDWLAADRIAVELMGFDFRKIGYLWFAHEAGLGQGDLSRIEVRGEKVTDHLRKYRPHDSIEKQYGWM